MMEHLAALATLRFDWADTPDHIWRDSPYHVDGLHDDVMAAVDLSVRDAEGSDGPSPIGLVLQGQKGVGKTHLLGMVRRRVHEAGGYFFLDDLTSGEAFWENTADALRRGLSRPDSSGKPQLMSFLQRVCQRGGVDPAVTAKLVAGQDIEQSDLNAFMAGLRHMDWQTAKDYGDTARALALYARDDPITNDVGEYYLAGLAESERGERRRWGIRPHPKSAANLVQEMAGLLAATGPIVIAVDQLDTLIARSTKLARETGRSADTDSLVAQIADGLMRLREVTRRTVTLLACLPGTWAQVRATATNTVPDRFRETSALGRIIDVRIARALVERRLGVAYERMGFVPPYPTWPVAPSAFEEKWKQYTPRELLQRISAHMQSCLVGGQVSELTSFEERVAEPVPVTHPTPEPDRFVKLDAEFERLRSEADISALLDQSVEDKEMPVLLLAALRGWIIEVGDDNMEWEYERRNGGTQLHAWLTHTVDEASDLEEHWGFRVICADHPLAMLSRLRKAQSAVTLRKEADNRHLVIVHKSKWRGRKTLQEVKAFDAVGGQRIKLSESDVRTFWALNEMFGKVGPELHEWLVDRRPASRSELLSAVLAKTSGRPRENGTRPPPPAPLPPSDTEITLGTVVGSGEPVRIELSALRKHTAVFAGSGSGKTVLLRRVIEECAIRGVSAIVLDPNNDLARLGEAWPVPPTGWGSGDEQLAKQYLDSTDVVVWTPGRANGRPLAFQPLPDFASALDDDDEFNAAVEVAVATLAPQLQLRGNTRKVNIALAVLRQAVIHHARTGSRSLPELIEVLGDLPPDVSTINDSRRIAAELAEALKAAVVNDPLFAGTGKPIDPGLLLTPKAGRAARVSVISFVGLPAEEQRQNFVNQLQMELFAWIKRNPAADRPLGGLFVMDEAQTLAASGTLTASTRSTIVLASQARKYGLGLLFATQAPKGLHNQVVGNAMTQFFGRLNSPAQIAAANDMAKAKGSPVADIGRLERAQFYVSGEAFGFRQVTTPLCLTHHPATPLRLEEVIERAKQG